MSDLDHLGGALRERLHAHVADISPSTELWASIDAIPETERRLRLRDRLSWRRLAVTVPVPIAAAVAAVLAFGGATPTASLGTRITWLPNGEMRLPDDVLEHPAQANADLRRHHIKNLVIVPMTASCPVRDYTYIASQVNPPKWPVNLIEPKGMQKGWIVVQAGALIGGHEDLTVLGRFRPGHVPTCASTHAWGPNVGGSFKSWPAPKGQQG